MEIEPDGDITSQRASRGSQLMHNASKQDEYNTEATHCIPLTACARDGSSGVFPAAKNYLERRLKQVMKDVRKPCPWLNNDHSQTQIKVHRTGMEFRNSSRSENPKTLNALENVTTNCT